VARVLTDDAAREIALGRYRAMGYKPDDFARSPKARSAMCDCLSRAEDALEFRRPSDTRNRTMGAIRTVRRCLERELG